jgi:glycosyltransferase involved in cell wall biosynthesis
VPRRVLFISLKFPPLSDIGAKRALRLVRRLPAHGWKPTVLTLARGADGQNDPSLEGLLPADADVRRDYATGPLFRAIDQVKHRWSLSVGRAVGDGKVATKPRDSFVRRAIYVAEDLLEGSVVTDEWLAFLPSGVRAGQAILAGETHAVVYACGDPNSAYLAAWWLARRHDLPLVLDLRDPWALDPTIRALKKPWARWLEDRLERRVIADAARVILNTEEARKLYLAHYPGEPAEKFEVVHNAYDEDLVDDVRVARPERFTVAHFGNYHRLRSARVFLEGLARFTERRGGAAGRPRFVNFGEFRPDDLAYAGTLGLGDAVDVRGYVPYRECLGHLRAAHVLLLEQRNTEGVQIPGKLYDYLLARRPILSLSKNAELAGLLERTGAGVNVDPASPAAVAEALERFAALDADAFDARVDLAGTERYSAAWTSRRVAEILSAVS